jgi:hypothetical protein
MMSLNGPPQVACGPLDPSRITKAAMREALADPGNSPAAWLGRLHRTWSRGI